MAYPFPTSACVAPWLMVSCGCLLPPLVLENYLGHTGGCQAGLRSTSLQGSYSTMQTPAIMSSPNKMLWAFCTLFCVFCGKFHWKWSISMEMDVYNVETDPFLITESVGVEGCSAQNISTIYLAEDQLIYLSLKTMDLLYLLLNRVSGPDPTNEWGIQISFLLFFSSKTNKQT